ncbi:hypothetical protein BGW38_005080, partial [Lunasporangiospora selenospora]
MDEQQQEEQASESRFDPPLWMQRRMFALRVIDFGCGEGSLASVLVGEREEDPITHIIGVDVSTECLEMAADHCQPQDYDLDDGLRLNQLGIDFFNGSVAVADQRLVGKEALACMEVVEHLDADVLDQFWSVVLGAYKPKVVIVSTPNAEFNIYFPQLNYGTKDSTFRHWDHRCSKAAQEYGYSVMFSGVGRLPNSDPAVGHCSQIAVLQDLNPSSPPRLGPVQDSPYELISHIDYPVYNELHTEEENLAFLHNKIACLRPRPDEDLDRDPYMSYGLTIHDPSTEPKSPHPSSPQPPDNTVLLSSIWIIPQIRQRCKTRQGMYELMEKSPLVQLDLGQGWVTYNKDDAYWIEWDRQYDEDARIRNESYYQDQYQGSDDDMYD